MNKILLLNYDTKNGTYKTGPNQGKEYSIAIARFAGVSGRITSRIIPNVDVAEAFKGQMVGGTIVEAKVQPYSFKSKDGKDVNTNTKWVVQFDGESLDSAIKAHGKKPALAVATAPVLIQESADVNAD